MISSLNHIFRSLTGVTAILLFLALTSCIDDSTDGCPAGLSLRFEYTLNESNEDLFADQVTHLDLYLYDKDGYYVKSYKLLQSELENGNTFPLSLPAGSYTFVTWANMPDGAYQCTSGSKLEDMRVKLNASDDEADPAYLSLFHGMTTISVFDNSSTYPVYGLRFEDIAPIATKAQNIISLTQNTILLHILLKETTETNPLKIGDYSISITSSNGTYRYDNSVVGDEQLSYKPGYSLVDEYTLKSDFTLLRLYADDDTHIQIKNAQGKVIYDESLTTKIMESPAFTCDEDFDRCQELTLKYVITTNDPPIEGESTTVKLTMINDWAVIGQGGSVGR